MKARLLFIYIFSKIDFRIRDKSLPRLLFYIFCERLIFVKIAEAYSEPGQASKTHF